MEIASLKNAGSTEDLYRINLGLIVANHLGAVISGKYFLHPVSLAKKIMNESPHCVLSGEGAYKFAVKKNFPTYPPEELISLEAKEKLKVSYEEYMKWVKYFYGGGPVQQDENDTVSAVAMDANGIFACATSTGTLTVFFLKLHFRKNV